MTSDICFCMCVLAVHYSVVWKQVMILPWNKYNILCIFFFFRRNCKVLAIPQSCDFEGFNTICCHMSSSSSILLRPLETTKVILGKSQPLWYCGYFCKLPGVQTCPRNGWGLKNVVGATLFMQSTSSFLGERECSENRLALFYFKIFWLMFPWEWPEKQ